MGWQDRFSLAGKNALITGGSKGIGLEIARVFADAGADVAVTGRDRPGLDEARSGIEAAGRQALVIEADLAERDAPDRIAKAALDGFGRIDILVNNAGVARVDDLIEQPVDDWDLIMAVNLRAPFLMARAIAPHMIERKSGKIINVSSQAGSIGLQAHGAYCASKGGLNLLTKVMAVEWSKHNIQINAISPNIILTPMGEQVWGDKAKSQPMLDKTPLGRFGKPIEVADLALFLASGASDFMTGENVLIDGGFYRHVAQAAR